MADIAVINKETHELDVIISATMNDVCRDGFYFVEIPKGYIWDNETKSLIKDPRRNNRIDMETI
jgi:hypothetical protein